MANGSKNSGKSAPVNAGSREGSERARPAVEAAASEGEGQRGQKPAAKVPGKSATPTRAAGDAPMRLEIVPSVPSVLLTLGCACVVSAACGFLGGYLARPSRAVELKDVPGGVVQPSIKPADVPWITDDIAEIKGKLAGLEGLRARITALEKTPEESKPKDGKPPGKS